MTDILTMGGQVLLSHDGSNFVLDDGTLSASYAAASGAGYTLGLALGNVVQPELVAEGEFEYPDVWLPHSEWDTSGGEAQITNPTADRSLEQVINPTDGKSHKVKVNILELPDTKYLRVVLGGGSFVDFDRVLGAQTKTVIAGSGANLDIKPSGSDTGTLRIDSVSVQEIVNKMQLTINGTAEAELDYTPITQGTVEIGATHRDSRIDKERSFADAQAKVLGWQV